MTPWEELQSECLQCRACSLANTRKNVVFGMGAIDAEVLFIGEGPGASEDEQGLPFVGAAGAAPDGQGPGRREAAGRYVGDDRA